MGAAAPNRAGVYDARDSETGGERTSIPPSSGVRHRAEPYIVLVGLDLSEPGGRAWRFAFDLAALRGDGAEVHAVVVGARGLAPRLRDVTTPGASSTAPSGEGQGLPPLKVLQHRSAGGQARLMAMHFRSGRPDRAIVRLAQEIGADVIVVASQPATSLQLFRIPMIGRPTKVSSG